MAEVTWKQRFAPDYGTCADSACPVRIIEPGDTVFYDGTGLQVHENCMDGVTPVLSLKYKVTATFEDDTTDSIWVRFPSRGWFLCAGSVLGRAYLRRRGPLELKDGSAAALLPDGSIEFREPESQ